MNKCFKCGCSIQSSYYSHYFPELKEYKNICGNCFHKVFWEEVLNDPKTIIINKVAYCRDYSKTYEGFGGKRFNIKLKDGTIERNIGLWLNGEVPREYYKKDTAQWIC